MTRNEFDALIEQLRPITDLKVMDLVEEAGIDVAPWAIKHDGGPVANPRANPNYCYEWAFGEDHEPIVLCVWHVSLISHLGNVAYEGNMRARAKLLEDIAFDRMEARDTRHRAKNQAKRCDKFDFRVQRAYRKCLPLRVILLEGDRADRLGHDASKVSRRVLDFSAWHVHDYDEGTGAFTILRGAPSASNCIPEIVAEATPKMFVVTREGEDRYADQFSSVDRREQSTWVFMRSAAIRRSVLERAAGHCEYCGRVGFLMESGQVYLETHHVVPLCEGGPDLECNVAALCPEDHRRAHLGADADAIRQDLLARLADR